MSGESANGGLDRIVDGDVADIIDEMTGEPEGEDRALGPLRRAPIVRAPSRRSPAQTRKQRYLVALERACTLDDFEQVVKAILADAKGGEGVDARTCDTARKLLFDYCLGKPKLMDGEPQQAAGSMVAAVLFGNNRPRGSR